MRDRNPGEARRGDRRADAGNDLVRNSGVGEGESLFPAAAEHERIAALEADDPLSAAGGADEEPLDGRLRNRLPPRALADVEEARVRGEPERGRVDQRVVEDEIGGAQPGGCLQGQ